MMMMMKIMKRFLLLLTVVLSWHDGRATHLGDDRRNLQNEDQLPVPSHRWTFNGDADDRIGGVDGVLLGDATLVPDENWPNNQLLYLPCCDSSVQFNSNELKNSFVNYTVALWFKVENDAAAPGGFRYLYEEGGAHTGFAIRLNENSQLEAAVIENGGGVDNLKVTTIDELVEPGIWYHATAVYANGELSIIMNGKQTSTIDTGFGELKEHTNAAAVGSGGVVHWSSDVHFVGWIDNLRIWDGIALTLEQSCMLMPGVINCHNNNDPPTASPSESTDTPSPTASPTASPSENTDRRPNIVLIVADDMNFDSPGFMGGVAPNVTPNLDQLASESLVFSRAHCATSVCQPSRQAMLSGKYPPNYGNVGFFPMEEGTQTVVTALNDAGYITASFYKRHHMRPYSSFPWQMNDDNTFLSKREANADGKLKQIGRAPSVFGEATRQTIAKSKTSNKPFFLVINSADPHKPFHGTGGIQKIVNNNQVEEPSRVYNENEVTIPDPLPDLPSVRMDVAGYASSVRRLDDTVGACLNAIEEDGDLNNTVVMFVTDNGMPMPFGKFETYRDSLLGPLTVRWPAKIAPMVDATSLVSLTDLTPTILEMAGAPPLPDIDGRSLMPLLNGEHNVTWRDVIVGTRYEDIWYGHELDRKPDPEAFREELRADGWIDSDHSSPGTMERTMHKRGITDGTFHYIYNDFYNSSNLITAYRLRGVSLTGMIEAAMYDETMAERVDLYFYRTKEELYDTVVDPGSMTNLIGVNGTISDRLTYLRQELLAWMNETNDPVYENFRTFLNGMASEMPSEMPSAGPSSAGS